MLSYVHQSKVNKIDFFFATRTTSLLKKRFLAGL